MKRLVCSPSLTLLAPPADRAPRLDAGSRKILKLLSIFAREHPADLCARLLRAEARRVLHLPPLGTGRASLPPKAAEAVAQPHLPGTEFMIDANPRGVAAGLVASSQAEAGHPFQTFQETADK